MQGYSYQHVNNAWVCHKCSAYVDDPSLHEDSHTELVTVLKRWSDLLEGARDVEISDIGIGEVVGGSVPGATGVVPRPVYGRPEPVPDLPAGGPTDAVERALEATQYTTLGRSGVVGKPPRYGPDPDDPRGHP